MASKCLPLMFVLLGCLVHGMPEPKEGEHYKDGKHNDEYDQKAFLGESQKKEFDKLTQEESLKKLEILVDKIDVNGDGNITENELSDWIKYISLKESSDKTGKVFLEDYSKATKEDGLLSWQEFMNINYPGTDHDEGVKIRIQRDRRRFVAADENKDDKLTVEEYLAYRHPNLIPRVRDVFIEEIFETIDANKDGVASFEEIMKDTTGSEDNIKRDFNYRDKNQNGVLEVSEVKEWYFPSSYDVDLNEARHLILNADTDKNGVLTKKEILENSGIFIGSKATHWGETLKRPTDEL